MLASTTAKRMGSIHCPWLVPKLLQIGCKSSTHYTGCLNRNILVKQLN
jgi:hypothetical protein